MKTWRRNRLIDSSRQDTVRRAVLFVGVGLLVFGIEFSVHAQVCDSNWLDDVDIGPVASVATSSSRTSRRNEERKVPQMTETTYNQIAKAEEHWELGEQEDAFQILNRMIERGTRRYNEHEIAQVHQNLARIYNDIDQLDQVLFHFEKMLEYREYIREGQETSVLFTLAQLYFQEERYEESLDKIQDWMTRAVDPGPNPYYFVSLVFYQAQRIDDAIKWIEYAIALATQRNLLPIKRAWYNLVKVLYFEKEDYYTVCEILELLVEIHPDRQHWVELAGVYSELNMPKQQMYAMESAHALNFLDRESDFYNYSGLLVQEDAPIRAAWYLANAIDAGLVEENFKNMKALGQAYHRAQETELAIDAYERANEDAEDGVLYPRLADLYHNIDEFGMCIDTIEKGFELGGLQNPLLARLKLGMCQFRNEDLDGALDTFTQLRSDARQRRNTTAEGQARTWRTFVDGEIMRKAELRRAEGR